MHAIVHRLGLASGSIAFSFVLFTAAQAAAAPGDRPGDYSHAMPVSVSGKQAVVQLPLPRAVYLAARQPGLRDLRLFDAAGAPVPFALIEQLRQEQESRTSTPVAVFPVNGQAGGARFPSGLDIHTGENGAVISVTTSSRRNAGDALVSLVLDLQASANASAPVDALVLELPSGTSSYSAQVALDISDDLQDWEELAVASLSWLVNSQGASVRKNRIVFSPRSFRYARIRWIDGTPIEFAGVLAQRVAQARTPERWDSVVLQPASPATGSDLVYEAPIAVPVQSIGLDLQGQNVVMPVLVGHYRQAADRGAAGSSRQRLQPVAKATFFRLTQNGQRRESGDIGVPVTHASQWVVRPQTAAPERPGLRLRWMPDVIVFVAGGRQPYTLAFGRTGVASSQVPVSQVAPGFSMGELSALEQARAGDSVRQQTEGEVAGSAGEERAASRVRVLWLWALLLAGVGALALMAWKLARQMKEGGAGQPPA